MNPAATAYLDQVRAAIEEHGFVIQATSVPDQSGPPALLSYTVGMTGHGLPELMVMDPPTPWAAATILNTAGHIHRSRPGGLPVPSVLVINDALYAITEMTADITEQCANVARAIYGRVRLLMLVTEENFEEAFQ